MTVEGAVQVIWDFMLMEHESEPSDLIWALGSHDLRVADRAADLWKEGLAPLIVMSGGFGNFTEGVFEKPEAELFRERAVNRGVPDEVILVENRSTNTGENVQFTKQLLEKEGILVKRAIAVQKPYMEKRTFATIAKQWEELEIQVTSPQLSLTDYCGGEISLDELIHIMVGDFQRLRVYPGMGFMIQQEVPDDAVEAWEFLVGKGFVDHLLPGTGVTG